MAKPKVVIFSLKDCPHCKKSKALLSELNVEFEEISLTDYPEKRSDMLQLADRLTVPQIFVRGKHIGGASDLQRIHVNNEFLDLLNAAPLDLADDPRLQKPDYDPKIKPVPEAPEDPEICIGGECLKYQELMQELLKEVPVKDHTKALQKVKQSFKGKDLVDTLESQFKLRSRSEAVQAAGQLLHAYVFGAADGSTRDFSDDGQLFRFQVHETGLWKSINTSRTWCTPEGCINEVVKEDPLGVLKRLKEQIFKIVSDYTDAQGMVDYVAVGADPAFLQFELSVCELQLTDLVKMEDTVRKAFVINLYNTIIPHSFAREGIANDDISRVTFFHAIKYQLGDQTYSLNELENGVLRGNRTVPFHLRKLFKADDPRLVAILPCDHRIHFALNCGAKSCPPVKWFTAEALDDELRVVAMAWVEQEENVRVDAEKKTLWLSMLCNWYQKDFGKDKMEVAQTIASHARGHKLEQIQQLLAGKFSIKYIKYDWSTNAANAKKFTGICVSVFSSSPLHL
jgi:glutaredoxin